MKEHTFLFKSNMINYTPEHDYLTIQDVSNITGIQERSIKEWMKNGLISTIVNDEHRFDIEDVKTFLACKTRKKSGERQMVY